MKAYLLKNIFNEKQSNKQQKRMLRLSNEKLDLIFSSVLTLLRLFSYFICEG